MAIGVGESSPVVTWVKYQGFAGPKIDGRIRVPVPETDLHMDHAYYLVAQLEAPTYGAVQAYDGCGMSAGPLHNIAVYPRDLSQGSLFPLLGSLERSQVPTTALLALLIAYREQGWVIGTDGKVRRTRDSKLVGGTEIRAAFTPPDGNVPRAGTNWETSRRWALLHHAVFADPNYFNAQKMGAQTWLFNASKNTGFYRGKDMFALSAGKDLTPQEDLALSVYHAYSVNAPAVAREVLSDAMVGTKKKGSFPAALISGFSRATYGNWQARYLRTRDAALKSGIWPSTFFSGKSAVFPLRSAIVG